MTKAEFFRYCETAEKKRTYPLRVTWGVGSSLEVERSVFLHGVWYNNSILQVRLYTPTPGRQGADCYQAAIKACERACIKFQNWLHEYNTQVKKK